MAEINVSGAHANTRPRRQGPGWQVLPMYLSIFVGVSLLYSVGLSWGLPNFWHSDEIMQRVLEMYDRGEFIYSVGYPNIPFYIQWVAVSVLEAVFGDRILTMVALRLLSVFLGAGTVLLGMAITQVLTRGRGVVMVAGILLGGSCGLANYSHFAHVDIYAVFFVSLSTYIFVLFYRRPVPWLFWLGMLMVGLAGGCKHNALSMLLAAPIILFLSTPRSGKVRLAGVLLVGAGVAGIGYAAGNPPLLIDAGRFLRLLLPFLRMNASFAGDAPVGLVGMWPTVWGLTGPELFWLSAFSIPVAIARALASTPGRRDKGVLVLAAILVSVAAPLLVSRYYAPHYPLPLVPLMTVFVALFLAIVLDAIALLEPRRRPWYRGAIGVLIVLVSVGCYLRVAGVALLFVNDSRSAVGEFLRSGLPPGCHIEYLSDALDVPPRRYFASRYPFEFVCYEGMPVAPGSNWGLPGLRARNPDFIILQSSVYDYVVSRPHFCKINAVECAFLMSLVAGKAGYRLVKVFRTHLPRFIPRDFSTGFLDPTMMLFVRASDGYRRDRPDPDR